MDISGMTQAGLFVTMALMFIGASPGSTGGGVKTTTFSITVAALWGPFTREMLAPPAPDFHIERITDLPALVQRLEGRVVAGG